MRKIITILLSVFCLASCNNKGDITKIGSNKKAGDIQIDKSFSEKERLGKLLFFEPTLSDPPGQSCSTCHDPSIGFADTLTGLPVSKGAKTGLYGNRNDMPVSYSMFAPPLEYDPDESVYFGGLFWDGRANTLAEQALGPPLNPLEMANHDTTSIYNKLLNLDYSDLFLEVYGSDALADSSKAFSYMADAIEAYEMTSEVNPFNSKFDYWQKGEVELSEQEMRGFAIFVDENKGNCSACHPHLISEDGTPPLFTDYTYDNLGVPKNPENPFYLLSPEFNPDGIDYIDTGLGAIVNSPDENGKFRVPTLRNVAITPPYMHNGVFKTLFQVIAFYNTRDIIDWPPPEVAENVNMDELGDLGLTNDEMEDLIAFLETLTDHWIKD